MPEPFRTVPHRAAVAVACILACGVSSRSWSQSLEERWPTPNDVRTASGAPGPSYWQQRADYDIDVTLDDDRRRLSGTSTVDYHNHSPHELRYVWVQLDQNLYRPDSIGALSTRAPSLTPRISFRQLEATLARLVFDGGYQIDAVNDADGNPLAFTEVDTMMRVDLANPLSPGESTTFSIDFAFNIVDADLIRARGGYEHFDADDNCIYEMAQFFPRVAAYTDYTGWQHKSYLGVGEFALELGDYTVRITVPADMVVAATGVLQNPEQVLRPEWRERLEKVTAADKSEGDKSGPNKPTFIVTPEEAKRNESSRETETKTWVFHAENVRDFAFAASRKFIWDAMATDVAGQQVLAMSFYPNEAEPLWSQYSTEAIVHTLDVYGRYAFPYPYPVAISVNGPVYGMEYPMICFNGPRPEEDGTYSKATKYGLISVVIHEVGHNFFPMIVNSDERQWMWMDEGMNSFLQYLAEQEWEENYPSRRGEPDLIVSYMKSDRQRPIMTAADELLQVGPNAYSKPATALNILRETVLGREQFDFAFREYARRWRFKRPTPADFFRTIEDASGANLEWFWQGWFYTTDHVDIAIRQLELYEIDRGDPDEAAERKRRDRERREPSVSEERNEPLRRRIEWQPGLKDFYNSPDYDEFKVEEKDRKAFQKFLDGLDETERALLERTSRFYVVTFDNLGGLVMPIILRIHYDDGSHELVHLPAEIWRLDTKSVRKMFVTDKEIVRLELDPKRQTADTDTSNNHWPPKVVPSRFKLFQESKSRNEMQKAGLGKDAPEDGERSGEKDDD